MKVKIINESVCWDIKEHSETSLDLDAAARRYAEVWLDEANPTYSEMESGVTIEFVNDDQFPKANALFGYEKVASFEVPIDILIGFPEVEEEDEEEEDGESPFEDIGG